MTQIEQAAPVGDVSSPARHGVTLSEPVEIAKFWKNRYRRDVIVVSLSPYENRNIFSVRTHTTSQDGKMLPTTKGVAMVVERLPELAAAVNKALKQARELGLLPPDDGAG